MSAKKFNKMELNKENCILRKKFDKYFVTIGGENIFCYITEEEYKTNPLWREELIFTEGNFGMYARYDGMETIDA